MISRVARAAGRKASAQHRRAVASIVAPQATRAFNSLTRSNSTSYSRSSLSHSLSQPTAVLRRHFAIEVAKVPQLGDSITEGTVVKWSKNVGDHVDQDEVLVIIETDKVSVDIRAPQGGKLVKQLASEGDTIKVGDSLAEIDTAAQGAKKEAAPKAEKPKDDQSKQSADKSNVHYAQPVQESRGSERHEGTSTPAPKATGGVEAQQSSILQPGSKTVEKASQAPAKDAVKVPSVTIAPPAPGSRNLRRVPMSRMRQTIANRLKSAQNTAAMLTTFNEIDMTNIMEFRARHKDEFLERTGIKLGFMSAFVKASVAALQKFPDVNASIEGNEIVYHDYCDVSVAVSTPTGLVVPVLRNVESMNFGQVEAAIGVLGAKARKGQIALEDMVGGTFTISNGGVYGSLFGTPIINPPQSGILGMHGIFKRPVAIGDKVEIRPMMYIALTYDHRLIDGSTAVQFLKEIKFNVEDPARLLLS